MGDKELGSLAPVTAPANNTRKARKPRRKPEEIIANAEAKAKKVLENAKKKVANAANKKEVAATKRKTARAAKAASAVAARANKEKVNSGQRRNGEANHRTAKEAEKARAEALEKKYETEKKIADDEMKELLKAEPTTPKKGTAMLAKMRAHGFELSLDDHLYLTNHYRTDRTDEIKADLKEQASTMAHCDGCVYEKYLVAV
jgi:hypothetical protein